MMGWLLWGLSLVCLLAGSQAEVISKFELTSAWPMRAWSTSFWPELDTPTLLPDFNGTALASHTQNLHGEDGTNWKLGMLILSPLAFILGLLILLLNIYCNRKRKNLCTLKSYPETWLGTSSAEEHAPLSLKAGSSQSAGLASRSPSLRHGEILIEWKDGTITPLFDNFNYQTD